MIVLSPHAQEIERQEREAERERLIQRALEYAAQKREEERYRVRRARPLVETNNSVRLEGSSPRKRPSRRIKGTGGTKELPSIDVGTGGGRTAQHTPEIEFSQN